VFKNAGVDYQVVKVPLGAADMTPQLQSAIDSRADAVGMTGDLTFCASFLQGYQTLAMAQTRYLIATCIDKTVVDAYPDLLAGSVMTGGSPNDPSSADSKVYAALASKYGSFDPDPAVSTGQSIGVITFLSVFNALKGLTGDVTAPTVLNQMKTATKVPVFLGGGATYTCDGKAVPLLANICSAQIYIGTIDSKGTLQDPKLVDTSALFAG
jgi:branched-chain amino acid transport system substrate-binding protein